MDYNKEAFYQLKKYEQKIFLGYAKKLEDGTFWELPKAKHHFEYFKTFGAMIACNRDKINKGEL